MDLVQHQVDKLFDIIKVGCISHQNGLCITPVSANVTAYQNQSKILSEYLSGNWTQEAELLTKELLFKINDLNSTRLEPMSLADINTWLSSLFLSLKNGWELRCSGRSSWLVLSCVHGCCAELNDANTVIELSWYKL